MAWQKIFRIMLNEVIFYCNKTKRCLKANNQIKEE